MTSEDIILFIIFVFVIVPGVTWLTYRVTRFEYKIEERYIGIKWYYLGFLPLGTRVKLDSIIDLQLVDSNRYFSMLFKSKPWPMVWGKFPPKLFWSEFPSKLLFIKKRGFFGTVIISPPDPIAFAEELRIKWHSQCQASR